MTAKGKILKIKCDPKGKMETMSWKALKSMQGDFKTLDDEGRQTLRASMEKVGFKAPFFVWYGHDELLDGVQRTDVLEDMVSDGWTIPDKLPVVLIEAKSRREALEDIARFSSQHGVVTEQGAINLFGLEGLKVILPVIRILNIDIPKLILNEQYKDKDPDDIAEIVDRGAELNKKWKVKSGDLWTLGNHRLLCGDSTKKEDVERLTGGRKIQMLLTDPPYGVNYSGKNEFLNRLDKGNRIQKDIKNDTEDSENTVECWRNYFRNVKFFMLKGANFYINFSGDKLLLLLLLLLREKEINLPEKQILVWVKNNHVLGRSNYNYKHEFILYGWNGGQGHKHYGGFDTTVWNVDKPFRNDLHPTMKPIE